MKVKGILPGLVTSLVIAIISQGLAQFVPALGAATIDSIRNHWWQYVSETTATWSGD